MSVHMWCLCGCLGSEEGTWCNHVSPSPPFFRTLSNRETAQSPVVQVFMETSKAWLTDSRESAEPISLCPFCRWAVGSPAVSLEPTSFVPGSPISDGDNRICLPHAAERTVRTAHAIPFTSPNCFHLSHRAAAQMRT